MNICHGYEQGQCLYRNHETGRKNKLDGQIRNILALREHEQTQLPSGVRGLRRTGLGDRDRRPGGRCRTGVSLAELSGGPWLEEQGVEGGLRVRTEGHQQSCVCGESSTGIGGWGGGQD